MSKSGTDRIRMKRAKILAQVTEWRAVKTLDRKSRLDRNLFAGNPVLVNGDQVNTICCEKVELPPLVVCPCSAYAGTPQEPCIKDCESGPYPSNWSCVSGCQATTCHRYQYDRH